MPPEILGQEAMMELVGQANGSVMSYAGKGNVARRLLNANMNPMVLRTNATLRYDEWKQIDRTVIQIARQRLVLVNALVAAGLTYSLANGMGSTVLQYQDASDISEADMTMDGLQKGTKDRPDFGTGYLPIPITHKSFNYSARILAASRQNGNPLDVVTAGLASKKVAEKVETTFLTGASSYAFGGGTLYGLMDFPYRSNVPLSEQWDASGCTGEDIIGMIINMIDAANDARHYGPFLLCIPGGYSAYLSDDYKANGDRSIQERILAMSQISQIITCDFLTAHNVILVQATSDVIQVVVGMQPTTVEWETEGGLNSEFKVMSIIIPWLKADQEGRSGIVRMYDY